MRLHRGCQHVKEEKALGRREEGCESVVGGTRGGKENIHPWWGGSKRALNEIEGSVDK